MQFAAFLSHTLYWCNKLAAINSICIQLFTLEVFACAAGGKLDPTAVSVQSGKTYEQEFAPEIERAQVWHLHFLSIFMHMSIAVQNGQKSVSTAVQTGKSKTTPWGSGYRPAPPLLHGMASSCCCTIYCLQYPQLLHCHQYKFNRHASQVYNRGECSDPMCMQGTRE